MQQPCEDEVTASVISSRCDIRADFSDYNMYLIITEFY
jgi:hypothetical protein